MVRTVEELRGRLPSPTAVGAAGVADPTSVTSREGHRVTRCPEQLHLHPALEAVGWNDLISEFNDAIQFSDQSVPEPILITSDGTILAGFARWRLAAFDGRRELHCIEYELSPDEALRFLLAHHQPRVGWNAFVRIRLALTLEPYFQQKALANMREGGKYKGLANLPEADRIDVRQEIAKLAGTGTGNVTKVKTILRNAHPHVLTAIQSGVLSIHKVWQWCKLPKPEQKEEFVRYEEERIERKVLREIVKGSSTAPSFKLAAQVIERLLELESRKPGSITVRTTTKMNTMIIVGQDLLIQGNILGDGNA